MQRPFDGVEEIIEIDRLLQEPIELALDALLHGRIRVARAGHDRDG